MIVVFWNQFEAGVKARSVLRQRFAQRSYGQRPGEPKPIQFVSQIFHSDAGVCNESS